MYIRNWDRKTIHSFSDSSFSRGVSILFSKKYNIDILNVHNSNDGRNLLINAKIEDELFTIVNVYAPNKECDRLRFLNSLKKFISTFSEQ